MAGRRCLLCSSEAMVIKCAGCAEVGADSWFCIECLEENECTRCTTRASLAAAAAITCPGLHHLRPYTAPRDSINCDRCLRAFARGDPFRGCKACVFVMCVEACAESAVQDAGSDLLGSSLNVAYEASESMRLWLPQALGEAATFTSSWGLGINLVGSAEKSKVRSPPPLRVPVRSNRSCTCGKAKEYDVPSDRIKCTACDSPLSKGTSMIACKSCRETLCRPCSQGENGAASQIRKKRVSFEDPKSSPSPRRRHSSTGQSVAAAKVSSCKTHRPKIYDVPHDSISCGNCKVKIPKGASMVGCKSCRQLRCLGCDEAASVERADADRHLASFGARVAAAEQQDAATAARLRSLEKRTMALLESLSTNNETEIAKSGGRATFNEGDDPAEERRSSRYDSGSSEEEVEIEGEDIGESVWVFSDEESGDE